VRIVRRRMERCHHAAIIELDEIGVEGVIVGMQHQRAGCAGLLVRAPQRIEIDVKDGVSVDQ
jgi:hypothetical protein